MTTLVRLFCLTLLLALFAALGFSGEKISGFRSTIKVTPRYVPSFARLPSTEERLPSSEKMNGEEEDHLLTPQTQAEYEAMKHAILPRFDGKGILTIDKNPDGARSINGITQLTAGPTLSSNFEGTIQDFSIPCDAMVAVGPNHVISTGNSTIRIRTKAGVNARTVTAAVFMGGGSTTQYFDPKVLYDIRQNRFIVLYDELVDNTEANYFIAVSQTSDAMGGWFVYTFNMQPDGNTPTNNWADFPGLGIDDNSVYITANMYSFPTATASFQKVKTRVLDKNSMYAGLPVGYAEILGVPGSGVPSFTLKPCLSLSSTTEEFLLITPYGGGNALGLYHITGGPFDPVLDKIAQLTVSNFGPPPDGVQLGCSAATNAKIKSGDARTQDPVWRDGYLYATHTIGLNIDTGHVSAIRYYKINTTTQTLVTDETFGAADAFYFYPSVTVDAAGTAYFSFGRSNKDEFASAWYSGRRRTDANIQPRGLLKSGQVTYRCTLGQRWGDYEGVAIDPSDSGGTQSSAWAAGLWAKGSNTWGSWLGKTAFLFHQISGTVLEDCDSSTGTAGDRRPVPLVTVVLHRDTTIWATTTTDSVGNYHFGLLDDGTYDVTVTIPPLSFALDAIPGSGGTSQTRINATDIQVALSGAATASQLSTGNNFLIVRPHPSPSTTSISPNTYSSGEPDFTLTVFGSNFVPCSVVRFQGSPRATSFISPTQLQATVLASDIDSTGSFLISVFSQTPNGGLSNTQKITVHTPAPVFSGTPSSIAFGSVLVGHLKTDTIVVTNTGTATLSITSAAADNPQFSVSPPSASIARQTSQAFMIGFTPSSTSAAAGHVVFAHNAASSPDSFSVNGAGRDSTSLRSATAREWATAVDTKSKHASMKRKADKVFFKLSLTAPADQTVDHVLLVSFNIGISRLTAFTSKVKSDTLVYSGLSVDPQRKNWTYNFGASPLAAHHEIQLDGVGSKGKTIKAKYTWFDQAMAAKQKGVIPDSLSRIDKNQLGLPAPNLNNVGEELFPKGFGQGSSYFSDLTPLIVGVPKGPKGASSVRLKKYSNVIKSFIDAKTGTQHLSGPTCLNKLISGDSIKSQLPELSPLKKNDRVFAELLAVKLNIAASATHKFPIGLGELTYSDPSDPAGPFNSLLVSDIVKDGDTLMACLSLAAIHPSPSLGELLSVLIKLNTAFAETSNFKDTVSFLAKTVLQGVKPLGDVPYLHATPGIVPVTFVSEGSQYPDVPLAYALYQNYPNPFNPVTTIAFDLPEPAVVTLRIYDVLGREVTTLADHQLMDEGSQETSFDAAGLATGVYFYRLVAEGMRQDDADNVVAAGHRFIDVKKMILVR
ncbi:MAG TPA: choice-of-anchor D domain-containing protein [Bacteroidota bacterium]|nr:choice-of-anchor D domain-containing protein [Bacteroidota bacterium]